MPNRRSPRNPDKRSMSSSNAGADFGPLLREQIRIQEEAIRLWKWSIFGLVAAGVAILAAAQFLKLGGPAVGEILKLGGAFVGVLGVIPYREMIPRKERRAAYRYLLAGLSSSGLTEEGRTELLALAAEAFKEMVKR